MEEIKMKIKFAVYGSGWRSEFFLRVANALPERFEVTGLITRSAEKAKKLSSRFGVKCYNTAEELLQTEKPMFMVVSVAGHANAEVSLNILKRGIPVLLETPPAGGMASLLKFYEEIPSNAKIQIAEQYPLHPMHMARLAFLKTGKLGTVQHAQISFSHGYHGVALIRKYLGIGFENAEITAVKFPVSVVDGFTREGEPTKETILKKSQTIAVLNFGDKTGLLNFEIDQHRSWVRSLIIQVKGTHGELFNSKIKYLHDFNVPIESKFVRKDLGQEDNFEGFDLKGIIGDGKWLYRNPYQSSRLVDDEIAVAECLVKMAEYLRDGKAFYGLSEASQDQYLSILIDEAVASGKAVHSKTQKWGYF